MCVFSPGVAAAGAGSSEGVSSHRESQRPQRLQEAAQDENQRSGGLHQDRLEKTDIYILGFFLDQVVEYTHG